MDLDFKFSKQISSELQKKLFPIKAKLKPILSGHDFEKIIHAFISTRLDYCNALYAGVSQASLSHLQLVQNAAASLLTGTQAWKYLTFHALL